LVASVQDGAELRGLIQQAERAFTAGQRTEGERLLARARAISPDHPLVLNATALDELRRGEFTSARAHLERAVAQDGANPAFWINLATAFQNLRQPEDELKALERALAIEPRHLLVLLQKGYALQQLGRQKAAAKVYRNALQTIPRGAQVAAVLRPAVERALQAVRADEAALESFLRERLDEPRRRHVADPQDRFDHCIDGLLGKRRIFTPQPTFLHFPKLPAWEFYPRKDFPWLDAIDAATAEIRSEFERVLAEDSDRLQPYVAYPEGVPLDQWAELNHSRRWSVFYLWRTSLSPSILPGAREPRSCCARLHQCSCLATGLLRSFPFSMRSRTSRRTPASPTRLIARAARDSARLSLSEWFGNARVAPGESWVFDDSIDHEAWNDSDVPRGILIFDIWNPHLTPAETDLVRTAVQGLRAYYRDESPPRGSE
jgi:Flp pilus assembly protein TadD